MNGGRPEGYPELERLNLEQQPTAHHFQRLEKSTNQSQIKIRFAQ
jgi:hypothetical protein